MQPPFFLTEAAKKRLRSAVEECRQVKGIEAIPALVWVDAALNAHQFPSHLAIGLYDNRDDISDALYDFGDIEVGVAMGAADFQRLLGRTVDWTENDDLVMT